MTEDDGFEMFLVEYKKRLPDIPENKDFHTMIDYMIMYNTSNQVIYQERWDDWISPNDPRYWRDPTNEERKEIVERNKERKQDRGFISKLLNFGN